MTAGPWGAPGARARCVVAAALISILAALAPRSGSAPASTPASAPTPAPTPNIVSHGRFRKVAVYAPHGTPSSVVLFLSGEAGWSAGDAAIARELARRGALVAGIDSPKLAADFEADTDDCVFPDGDLENFSHFLQAFYHLPTYLAPLLMGHGSGASLAYGTLAQAPADTFAGAITLGFCPATSLRKPLCKGSGVQYAHRAGARPLEFSPVPRLANPWVLLQGERDQVCGTEVSEAFIAHMPGAALAKLPGIGHDVLPTDRWLPPLLAAFDSLAAHAASARLPPPPAGLTGLPIVEVPAQSGAAAADSFAIILSGDGGWAGLDKDVALALSAQGIPVVGVDSLRYFWSARTPQGLAADVDRMIRYYLTHWNKRRVLLIGYSQGADVLPFAVNRLSAETRARVALTTLMGMSEHALFEFHLSSWISDANAGSPTLPEVDRMSGALVLCIYGQDEGDSLCPKLDPKRIRIVKLKGGHHFDGDYAGLARAILATVQP